jgi:WD40 repeat protein
MGAKISHIQSFKGHKGPVYAFDGVYSGGSDAYLVQWDLETGEGLALAKAPDAIFGLCATDSGVFLSTLGGSLFHFIHGEPIRLLLKLDCPIYKLVYSHGILSAIDQHGRYWESENFQDWNHTQVHAGSLRGMIGSEGQLILSGAQGQIFERKDGTWVKHADESNETIYSLVKSGETLITAGKDAQIRAWEKEQDAWNVKQSVPAHMNAIYALSLSHDGRFLLSASRDHSVKIWDAQTLELLKVMDATKSKEAHSRSVNHAQWLDDSRFITAGDDGQIKLWHWDPS